MQLPLPSTTGCGWMTGIMSSVTKTILRVLAAFVLIPALLEIVAVIDSRPSVVGAATNYLVATLPDGTGGTLNSNFVTSIVGALAGAFFGAWGAQKIAARAKRRDDHLSLASTLQLLGESAWVFCSFTNSTRSSSLSGLVLPKVRPGSS